MIRCSLQCCGEENRLDCIKKTKLDISYNPLACYHGYQDDRKAFRMIHSEILEPIMKI